MNGASSESKETEDVVGAGKGKSDMEEVGN